MQKVSCIFLTAVLLFALHAMVAGQKLKTFSKEGVTFEYSDGWNAMDESRPDLQQINIASEEFDSQIRIIVLRKRIDSMDAMAELKRTVVDPWLTQLINGYTHYGINVERSPASTEVAVHSPKGQL